MKQKRRIIIKKWIVSIFTVGLVLMAVRYGFLLAFLLTTPKKCGLNTKEFTFYEGIKKEIDQLHLNKKFYRHILVYRCRNGENVQFDYSR